MALCKAPVVPRALAFRVALPPHEFDVVLRPGDDVRQIAQRLLQIHRIPVRQGPALMCVLAAAVEEVQYHEVDVALADAFPADGPATEAAAPAPASPGAYVALRAALRSPALAARVADLVGTLAAEMAEVAAARDGWLRQVRDRHEREMNALATRCLRLPPAEGPALTQALVEKHEAELRDEAGRLCRDVEDVAQRQRRDFVAGLEALLAEERRSEPASTKGRTSRSASLGGSGEPTQGTAVTIALPPRPAARPPEADRLALASVLAGGPAAPAPRPATPSASAAAEDARQRSASVLSMEGCLGMGPAAADPAAVGPAAAPLADAAAPSSPPRPGEGSLTVELCKGPPALAFSGDGLQARGQRVASLEAIVAGRLTACLLLSSTTSIAELRPDFYRCCTAAPELLFESLDAQWAQALQGRAVPAAGFAITRHSNLNGVHVAFHALPGPPATLEATVGRILEMCACWHIACLAIDLTALPVAALEAALSAVVRAVAAAERRRHDGDRQPALAAKAHTTGLSIGAVWATPPLSCMNTVQCRLHVSSELHRKVKAILRSLAL